MEIAMRRMRGLLKQLPVSGNEGPGVYDKDECHRLEATMCQIDVGKCNEN